MDQKAVLYSCLLAGPVRCCINPTWTMRTEHMHMFIKPFPYLLLTSRHQAQRHSICYRGVCCCGGVGYTLLLLLMLRKHQCAGSCYMCCHGGQAGPHVGI